MDKQDKYLMRLCKNILAGKFNEMNYRCGKSYFGTEIATMPMFASYGTIGFSVTVYGEYGEMCIVDYDWEMKQLTIDGQDWKEWLNESLFEDNDIICNGGGEYECYTDAGEDMIINLDVCDKEHLQEYIDGFDINEKVALWWPNGEKGDGVPFDNMKEQYEDYEAYLERLQEVCDGMPF